MWDDDSRQKGEPATPQPGPFCKTEILWIRANSISTQTFPVEETLIHQSIVQRNKNDAESQRDKEWTEREPQINKEN